MSWRRAWGVRAVSVRAPDPILEPEFEQVITRGSSYCQLDRDEIPTAKARLESTWGVIDEHASFSREIYDLLH